MKEALPRIKEGKSKVFVDKVLRWNDVSHAALGFAALAPVQVPEVHELPKSNKTQGKIFCTIKRGSSEPFSLLPIYSVFLFCNFVRLVG